MRRPRATTLQLAAVIAASAAVTAACGISSAATTTSSLAAGPSGPPITVGVSLPLSGPAQAQGFEADGQACLKGFRLWASDVNSHGGLLGRPVRLVVRNDKGWPGIVASDYKTLITQDHVNLLLGPFSSLLTESAGPVAAHYGYALAAGSAGAPGVYALNERTMFSTNVPVTVQMQPFVNWVLSQPNHPLTAAYPMINDPFADPAVQYAMAHLRAGGVKTVYKTGPNGYPPNASTKALMADAAKVANSHAGIVVLGSVTVPSVAAFIKQWKNMGYVPKVFIASAGPDQGQAFLNAIGTGNADGIMVPNGWYGGYPNALSHLMVQSYIAKYGGTASDINADVAESYSAGEVLAAAVNGTGGTSNRSIIDWLHANPIQTVLGPVAFKNDGENSKALASALIFQWQPVGKFVQVLPPPPHLGSSPIIATKPPWTGG